MADQIPPVTSNQVPASNVSVPAGNQPVEKSGTEPMVVQSSQTGSSKGTLWVIVAAFIVVAVLVGAGIYMYMMARSTNPDFQQISQNVQESLDSAATDLEGVQVTDVSADFAEVDKELNDL
jgi:hypothetical protein